MSHDHLHSSHRLQPKQAAPKRQRHKAKTNFFIAAAAGLELAAEAKVETTAVFSAAVIQLNRS
jgi:hypothetical protein